jgi:hypothetical protein
MSSFMVEPLTIDRILSLLYWKKYNDSWLSEQLRKAGHSMESTKAMNELGMAMLEMNREAVNQRYNENGEVGEKYEFSVSLPADVFQALKSLRCFLYQCAEGTVPQKKLYKALSRIADYMTRDIVEELPQYQRAEWG